MSPQNGECVCYCPHATPEAQCELFKLDKPTKIDLSPNLIVTANWIYLCGFCKEKIPESGRTIDKLAAKCTGYFIVKKPRG